MLFGYWRGYTEGLREGRLQTLQEFERVLALVREQLSDACRERDAQATRADGACDLLLAHLGARAISLSGRAEDEARAERKVRTVEKLASMPDATDELPYGHPDGLYKSKADASLFAGEDVGSVDG